MIIKQNNYKQGTCKPNKVNKSCLREVEQEVELLLSHFFQNNTVSYITKMKNINNGF